MHQRPPLVRLFAAFVLVFALMGAWTTPSLAQEATPEAIEQAPDVQTAGFEAAEGETGTLLVFYYGCDGGTGFEWGVLGPGEGQPNPILETCGIVATRNTTFVIYPFGDLTAPREHTTVDGKLQLDLPVTTELSPHVIEEKLPEDSAEAPVTASFDIADGQFTMLNAQRFLTGTVELYKFRCPGNPDESFINVLNPAQEFDPAPYEACSPDVRGFTITPFGEPETFEPRFVTTFDGMTTIEDVPTTSFLFNPHEITEDGTDLFQTFEVAEGAVTVIVAVNYTETGGTLELTKYFCEGDQETEFVVNGPVESFRAAGNCVVGPADFSIYVFGDKGAAPIALSTDDGGFAEQPLPVTEHDAPHVIVEDSTQAEVAFEIADGQTTTIDVYNYEPVEPEPANGWVEIENLSCAGLIEPVVVVGEPDGDALEVPGTCDGRAGEFLIYPFGDLDGEPIAITVDDFDSRQVPVTDDAPHLLVALDDEGNPVAEGEFEIAENLFTPVQARFPAYGDVKLYSFICDGPEDSFFEIYAPGSPADLPLDCGALDRGFDIIPFGDGDPIAVNPGPDGQVFISGILATDGIPHVISKKGGDVQAQFDVATNQITIIVSIVYVPEDIVDDDDDYDDGYDEVIDDTGDSEYVDELPDTGYGPGANLTNGTLLLSLMSLASVVGVAALRRRPAA